MDQSCEKPQKDLFSKFTIDDFIFRAPFIVPCFASDCSYCFAVPEIYLKSDFSIPQCNAFCTCGTVCCLACSSKGHEPLNCQMAKDWASSASKIEDQLNTAWIKSNSKPCPSCKVDIQKNQGCMHMTCFKCKHQYCWLCLGDWTKHGSGTGGFFNCNMYKEEKSESKDATSIRRLQFYLDRYSQHKRSLETSEKNFRQLQAKLKEDCGSEVSILTHSVLPGSLDFYRNACQTVIKCRSFITFTYPLAYFMKNEKELNLFLQTQYMLEYSLEKLDKYVENCKIESLVVVKGKQVY